MRLEQIPLFIGIAVAILGLGLMLDAQLPEGVVLSRERRRRQRAARHRGGQTMVGLGVLAVAAALMGGDTWRYGTVSVLVGVVLLGVGGWFNREHFRELFAFRGAARRGEKRAAPRDGNATPRGVDDLPPASRAPLMPGLADSPPRRDPPALRGDREAPIMKATEGLPGDQGAAAEDTPPEGHPRLRIR